VISKPGPTCKYRQSLCGKGLFAYTLFAVHAVEPLVASGSGPIRSHQPCHRRLPRPRPCATKPLGCVGICRSPHIDIFVFQILARERGKRFRNALGVRKALYEHKGFYGR
jgi:hypothetical protein